MPYGPSRSRAVSCRAMSSSDQKTLFRLDSGADRPAGREPGGVGVGEQLVGAGADQRVGHPARPGPGPPPGGLAPQCGQPVGGRREAAGTAQRQPAFVARGAHRDPPALPRLPDDVRVRHEDVVEEELGEGGLAVQAADGAYRHALCVQREHQIAEPLVRLRRCPGRCGRARRRGRRRRPGTTRSSGRSAASRRRSVRRSSAATPGPSPPPAPTRPAPRSTSPRAMGRRMRARCSSVPCSKRVGARRLMPFWLTRPGAPAA